jgi:hypothetical protein
MDKKIIFLYNYMDKINAVYFLNKKQQQTKIWLDDTCNYFLVISTIFVCKVSPSKSHPINAAFSVETAAL